MDNAVMCSAIRTDSTNHGCFSRKKGQSFKKVRCRSNKRPGSTIRQGLVPHEKTLHLARRWRTGPAQFVVQLATRLANITLRLSLIELVEHAEGRG